MKTKGPWRCTLPGCHAICADAYFLAPPLWWLRWYYRRMPHDEEVRQHAWCKDHWNYLHPAGGGYPLNCVLKALAACEERRKHRLTYGVRAAIYHSLHAAAGFLDTLAERFA